MSGRNAFSPLLAYVSRAHEIEIRPASVRLWHRGSLNLLHGCLSSFSCGFPFAICLDDFFQKSPPTPKKKKKCFLLFFRNIFSFSYGTLWGQKCQNATPTNCSQKSFQTFLEFFFPMFLTKLRLGFLKF